MDKKEVERALKKGRAAAADYETGYGKPPEETRFKKGVSGNPKGRPKGSKNKPDTLGADELSKMILKAANQTVSVNLNGKQKNLKLIEATLQTLSVKSVKGESRSTKLFLDLVAKANNIKINEERDYLKAAIAYKKSWEYELERRRKSAVKEPDPLPHPDHILIDVRRSTVTVNGPVTSEEKEIYDYLLGRIESFRREIALFTRYIEQNEYVEHHDMFRNDIKAAKKTEEEFARLIEHFPGYDEELLRMARDFKSMVSDKIKKKAG